MLSTPVIPAPDYVTRWARHENVGFRHGGVPIVLAGVGNCHQVVAAVRCDLLALNYATGVKTCFRVTITPLGRRIGNGPEIPCAGSSTAGAA